MLQLADDRRGLHLDPGVPCPASAPATLALQLRELVQAQEEWPELAQNCLRQKKRIDGET